MLGFGKDFGDAAIGDESVALEESVELWGPLASCWQELLHPRPPGS
jgi:hypothetical protein